VTSISKKVMGQKRVGAWACFLFNDMSSATSPPVCSTTVAATRMKAARSVDTIAAQSAAAIVGTGRAEKPAA
jgi:hypothetical protein